MEIYQNYKKLLLAIKNTELEDNYNNSVAVYDTFENEMLIGIFNNLSSVARFFNITVDAIHKSRKRTGLFRGRYKIESLRGEL